MFRKVFFWSHLVSGVLAGLVILMMSVTGVLLTYERQILAWAEQSDFLSDIQGQERLTVDQLFFIAKTEYPDSSPTSIVITNDPGAPVTFSAGRSGGFSLNPLTGEAMETGSESLEHFFSTVTGIHRWFNLSGESRNTARAITGVSNLIFLFLLFSGFYLWFPKIWTWGAFRIRFLFRNTAGKSKARDFNWHHVMGFWSAIPLIFVVATASVFYYPWANNLVYQVYGEEAPQRRQTNANQIQTDTSDNVVLTNTNYKSLGELLYSAKQITEQKLGNWHSISINLPDENANQVEFGINQNLGGQPQKQFTLSIDRTNAEMLNLTSLADATSGQRARRIIRFLHTGEVFGLWGQTIAGLVSFAALLMVWTGFALAYRRLIKPLFM